MVLTSLVLFWGWARPLERLTLVLHCCRYWGFDYQKPGRGQWLCCGCDRHRNTKSQEAIGFCFDFPFWGRLSQLTVLFGKAGNHQSGGDFEILNLNCNFCF